MTTTSRFLHITPQGTSLKVSWDEELVRKYGSHSRLAIKTLQAGNIESHFIVNATWLTDTVKDLQLNTSYEVDVRILHYQIYDAWPALPLHRENIQTLPHGE